MSGRAVTAIVLAVVAVDALLVVLDADPDLLVVAVIVAAVGIAIWAARPLSADAPRPDAAAEPVAPPTPSTPDLRTAVLRQALGGGGSSVHHAERIRDQLVAIVDDQLIVAHGIDRAEEPERAQRMFGRDLARFVADPSSAHRLNRRRLDRILTQIEAL